MSFYLIRKESPQTNILSGGVELLDASLHLENFCNQAKIKIILIQGGIGRIKKPQGYGVIPSFPKVMGAQLSRKFQLP